MFEIQRLSLFCFLRIFSPLLYQLSYGTMSVRNLCLVWERKSKSYFGNSKIFCEKSGGKYAMSLGGQRPARYERPLETMNLNMLRAVVSPPAVRPSGWNCTPHIGRPSMHSMASTMESAGDQAATLKPGAMSLADWWWVELTIYAPVPAMSASHVPSTGWME